MQPSPHSLARAVLTALGVSAVGLGILGAWHVASFPAVPSLPRPVLRTLELQAKVVAGAADVLRTKRRGRVLVVHVAPGCMVGAGAPLVEFQDLALLEKRASLQRKISALQAGSAGAHETQHGASPKAGHDIRLAVLQDLRHSYTSARKDFARWTALYKEGLVARVEYERRQRDLAALRVRWQAAHASTSRPGTGKVGHGEPVPTELQRLRSLLDRLARLPTTFLVNSPRQVWVQEVHMSPGEIASRGASVVTVARFALPRLEASVERQKQIVAVQSACGIPGPFAFTIRDGLLSLLAPSPEMFPGKACRLELLFRP